MTPPLTSSPLSSAASPWWKITIEGPHPHFHFVLLKIGENL